MSGNVSPLRREPGDVARERDAERRSMRWTTIAALLAAAAVNVAIVVLVAEGLLW